VKIRILLAVLFVVWLVMLIGCDTSKSKETASLPVERLTVGVPTSDFASLIWVAEGKEYFSEHGLDVDITVYESGLAALTDLLAGKLDFATASDFALAHIIFDRHRPDLRIISILDQANELKLVARRDHGITQIADIRNKRVGLSRGTLAEFYLDLLMILQEIPFQGVQILDLSPSEQVKALTNGDVDAIVVWEPFAAKAREGLGNNGVSWLCQSGQDMYLLLVSTDEVIKRRTVAVRRFLGALASSEEFIKNNNDTAEQIVASQLGLNHVDSSWRKHRFGLGLDHPLMMTMEILIRWIKRKSGTQQSDIPDLMKFIYFDALNAVKPEKIKIPH
jgi:ABC-type nitrate/sulfonate/bicarbonate transport system substrate-binding protein